MEPRSAFAFTQPQNGALVVKYTHFLRMQWRGQTTAGLRNCAAPPSCCRETLGDYGAVAFPSKYTERTTVGPV